MTTPLLDRLHVDINGNSAYTNNIELDSFTVQSPPDSLARTATLRVVEVDQFYEAGNDIAAGRSVEITGQDERDVADDPTLILGTIIDKIPVESAQGSSSVEGTGTHIELSIADDLYRLGRSYVDFTANSQTITKDLFLWFKDDGSGSGGPQQYTRKAELRVFEGGNYFIPFEDMDNIPLHSLRRKKDGEHSIYYNPGDYEIQYRKKELVFKNAQVRSLDSTDVGADGDALPDQSTPAPDGWFDASYSPLGTDQHWTYKAVGSFFVATPYPARNASPLTIENILRTTVLGGTQLSEAGGAGFASAKLNIDYAYSKGAAQVIRDRLGEGMLVTAYTFGSSDITVSDGDAWAGKTDLTYTDVQGTVRSGTISGVVGNVVTLSGVPTGMLAGIRVYGCDQLGIEITLTSLSDSTVNMANYTDVVIGGTTYFIREIRDAATLVVVNADETGDFSGLGASGTLTYPTLEYTGLQIKRLNWDKTKGSIADFISFLYKNNLLPVNYRLEHEPTLNVIRGRSQKQYRGIVTVDPAGGAVVTVDNADGFIPGQAVCWYDEDAGEWVQSEVVGLDLTTTDDIILAANATGLSIDGKIYANCRIVYRWIDAEHPISLDNSYSRAEVISSANQAFPLLDKDSTSILAAAPSNVGLPAGSWSIVQGDADAMTDGSVNTMYLLRWVATAGGQLEGDPEEYNMSPLPWVLASFELNGGMQDVDEVLFYPGYIKDAFKAVADGYRELPLFTVEASADDVALASAVNWAACSKDLIARQFDPLNAAAGQLVFKCDLLTRFRHIRLCVDRPFFYKVKENFVGTPTRARDVPILIFNVYKKPDIRYNSLDEDLSEAQGAPDGQITPYLDTKPFAQLTNKGATTTGVSGSGPYVLTVPTGHNIIAADLVEFWDTSAGYPFAGDESSQTVSSVTPTTITVPDLPAGFVSGDKIGGSRRWLLDATGAWRDFHAPNTLAGMFETLTPTLIIKDESAQNGWDAQQIAALRLYENFLTVRDGVASALFDVKIRRFSQVVASGMFAPQHVAGISYNGYGVSLQLRDYNSSLEEIGGGDV